MLLLYLDFDGVLHHEDVRWSPKRGAYMQIQDQLNRLTTISKESR